jgi:1-deoxy-D-xylulose-5-phosphate synthase
MGKYLDMIDSPADVKKLPAELLPTLAQEVRDTLIESLAKAGGHLGPNLGVVELSIALHRVFETPKDKFIWDVSHQSYVHKLFTGRRQRIGTIRQTDGLCGFAFRGESPHDCFGAAHAGTALSAAVGIAKARDLRGTDENVVAIVGDAAMTCGVSYEALNNISTTKRLVVILNDNEWSIDKNVGAISKYLNQLLTNPTYNAMHRKLGAFVETMPFGKRVADLERKTAEAVKGIVSDGVRIPAKPINAPGNTDGRGGNPAPLIFEEMGMRYLGPIDGHDLPTLISYLEYAKSYDRPIIIHVITQKGRGAPFALQNPEKYHGCGPYELPSGKTIPSKPGTPPNWQDVFGDQMLRFCKSHSTLVGITGAMPSGTGLSKLRDTMPDRYFDVGIAEEHAVLFAAGLAANGIRPVCAIYSSFLQRAFDMIIHDVAIQNLPVIFCMDRAGLSAGDGPTHHGLFDIAYARCVPNTVLMQPKDEDELADMMATALTLNQPVFIRYPRGAAEGATIKEHPEILQVGKSEVIQHGNQVAIFSYGNMLPVARDAAKQLADQGYSVAIINARFAKPVDRECIERFARQCKVLVTFEDGVITGGFGSAVAETLNDLRIPTPVIRMGWPDRFVEWGSNNNVLRERYGLTAKAAVEKTLEVLREKHVEKIFRVVEPTVA